VTTRARRPGGQLSRTLALDEGRAEQPRLGRDFAYHGDSSVVHIFTQGGETRSVVQRRAARHSASRPHSARISLQSATEVQTRMPFWCSLPASRGKTQISLSAAHRCWPHAMVPRVEPAAAVRSIVAGSLATAASGSGVDGGASGATGSRAESVTRWGPPHESPNRAAIDRTRMSESRPSTVRER